MRLYLYLFRPSPSRYIIITFKPIKSIFTILERFSSSTPLNSSAAIALGLGVCVFTPKKKKK